LSLRILCGFGVDEIATAFLTHKETINKRLYRAKEKLRVEKVQIEYPSDKEIDKRLETVLTTLYLLFSEGYYSESDDAVLRKDFCLEAMRLTHLLIENEQTNTPEVNALMALTCFHSSRFDARKNSSGEIILYNEQDEKLWNQELITNGANFLRLASKGDIISKYHVEAGIAYWNTVKADIKGKWENILKLHDQLLKMEYSPMAALNRVYAISKVYGKRMAIEEAMKLNLADNHFYFTLLGDLHRDIDNILASEYYKKAISMARTEADKGIIQRKIGSL
jgi:predicted RNA polymerase sigma factor